MSSLNNLCMRVAFQIIIGFTIEVHVFCFCIIVIIEVIAIFMFINSTLNIFIINGPSISCRIVIIK